MIPESSEMESAEEERWAPIPGFDGVYSVSTWGRVRRDIGGRGTRKGRILKPSTDSCGYLQVDLRWKGSRRAVKVHRLVLTAFVGILPEGMTTAHNDGNKKNNRLTNLRYTTMSDNLLDGHRYGGKVTSQKLSLLEVAAIRQKLSSGESQRSIAESYGVCQQTISRIKTGENWSHRLDQTLVA